MSSSPQIEAVSGQTFEGGSHQLDNKVFKGCAFRGVELYLAGEGPFAFTDCTFDACTVRLAPAAYGLLVSLLAVEDMEPFAAFLWNQRSKLGNLPIATRH